MGDVKGGGEMEGGGSGSEAKSVQELRVRLPATTFKTNATWWPFTPYAPPPPIITTAITLSLGTDQMLCFGVFSICVLIFDTSPSAD